jgi:putative DNA primase/helicase
LIRDGREQLPPHRKWADYTPRGNGERLIDAHGQDLRHAPGLGWLEWDARRWAADEGNKRALARARLALLDMQIEADSIPGLSREVLKFVQASQAPSAWENAIKGASLLPPIACQNDAFDDGASAPPRHEFRFNLANGTLDLETGKLSTHRREDMITKFSPVAFDPAADGALWDRFLRAAQPDSDRRSFLQRLAGYWMTGHVRDEVFPIFWGAGGNGKGTYLDTIRHALGEYAGSVPEDVLIATPGHRPHPTGLMIFKGLRLAIASETNEGDRLAISTLKRLTGGDSIRARHMGKDFVEFEPTHKIVLMTNPRPRLGGNVNASLKRRIFFVPWEESFDGAGLDTSLKPTLSTAPHQSAVLNWLLEGYREYRRIGLAAPASVLAATSDYMQDEDTLAAFIEERCEFGEEHEIGADDLYKAYKAYCKEVSEVAVLRTQDFKPAFLGKEGPKKAGVTWKRTNKARLFQGVRTTPKSAEDYAYGAQRAWPH